MKIFIEKVQTGATYQKKIYDFWIKGETKNGLKLMIFDGKQFDLREYEGKIINCLIYTFMVQKINTIDENVKHDPYHPIIRGIYLGKYDISSKWKNYDKILRCAISTKDGIFLMSKHDLENIIINIGEEIIFTIGRLDLLDWNLVN